MGHTALLERRSLVKMGLVESKSKGKAAKNEGVARSNSPSYGTGLVLGCSFPDFVADSTFGPKQRFHEYIDGSWAILMSHPADFTPVCTSEIGTAAKMQKEFTQRGVKLAALSCDPVDSHKTWSKDISVLRSTAAPWSGGANIEFPIFADTSRDIAVLLGMLDPEMKDATGLPLTCRAIFIIGPDKRLKLSMLYPASTGRSFTEILRAVDSLQLAARAPVGTPEGWLPGQKCMVAPSVAAPDEPPGTQEIYVCSGKRYLRLCPSPA